MICIWYKIYFHIKIYIFGTFGILTCDTSTEQD